MARVSGFWKKTGNAIEIAISGGADLLMRGVDRYINFGDDTGSTGYGIRDNAGTLQFKNNAGAWTNFGEGTWSFFATTWSTSPTLNSLITGGSVYNYTLKGTTRYRFVPSTYTASADAFYSTFSAGTLSGLLIARG